MLETFGQRIRRLREEKDYSQEQVAAVLNVNRKAVSHYENDLREPSFETLVKLAQLYRVRTDYLLGVDNSLIITASGLTDEEYSLISVLVADLAEKNAMIGKASKQR